MSRDLICDRSGSVLSLPERKMMLPFGATSTAESCEVRPIDGELPSRMSVQSHVSIGLSLLVGSHMTRSSWLARMHSPEATVHVVQPVSQSVTPDEPIEKISFVPAGAAD